MAKLDKGSVLYDKILGCLAGGALGDAMGATTEMMTYQKIEELFGWVDRPLPSGRTPDTARFSPGRPAGVYTDDTQLKHLVCEAIIRKNGRVTADDLAATWLERMQGWFYTPVVNAYHKVYAGDARPREAGHGCMASNSSAMSISPIGIINACNPTQAAQDAYDVASLIHEGYARDGACAVAAAVAAAFCPDATTESILQAATDVLYPKGEMKARIQQALDLAQRTGEYKAFRRLFYEEMLLPFPQNALVSGSLPPPGFYDTADPRETIPTAMALVFLADGDWRRAVEYAANFGRDADTTGTIVGAITGALKGAHTIPPEWIDLLNRVNPVNQYTLAHQIGDALVHTMDSMHTHLQMLHTLASSPTERTS
jgi:ADP-ribosylglycohydrolase